MAYANSEKETTCVYDYETKEWTIYSCVPRHMTKLGKIGEPYWKEEEPDKDGKPRMIAGKWKLKSNQVRFAKLLKKKEGEPTENDDLDDDETDEEEVEELEKTLI